MDVGLQPNESPDFGGGHTVYKDGQVRVVVTQPRQAVLRQVAVHHQGAGLAQLGCVALQPCGCHVRQRVHGVDGRSRVACGIVHGDVAGAGHTCHGVHACGVYVRLLACQQQQLA